MMHNGGVAAYRERVSWPGWFFAIVFLGVGGGFLGIVLGARAGGSPWAIVVSGVPLLVVALVLWRMRFVELEFGPEGAAFGFGGLRRRVPKERILGAEVQDYPVARYMGWGYRFGWEPRERAYSILGYRRGVVLRFEDERGRTWRVFLSSADPESAIAAL